MRQRVPDKGIRTMMKRKRRPIDQSTPQTLTRAVTHIRLEAVNASKFAALDNLAQVYLPLCQQYVDLFCTQEVPDKFRSTCFPTPLSERWHRVAIQQAAGIARSWRTNREFAYQGYLEEVTEYQEQQATGNPNREAREPVYKEWNVPKLRQTVIQANTNVVVLEPSHDSTFDYWLKISTLEFRRQLLVPVKLADYHRRALEGKTINTSVRLDKRGDGWWLTLSYDEVVPIQTEPSAQVVGVDVGIANFLTTSTGKHYGTFSGTLRERQKRDREKRRRKAKLRRCLEKKGVKRLPSTKSKGGQRLARHVRQEINRAVNECFTDHPNAQFAYEQLSVAKMKFKARAMNAYLYASNLRAFPNRWRGMPPNGGLPQGRSKAPTPRWSAVSAIVQTEPTGPTSKRFAA